MQPHDRVEKAVQSDEEIKVPDRLTAQVQILYTSPTIIKPIESDLSVTRKERPPVRTGTGEMPLFDFAYS